MNRSRPFWSTTARKVAIFPVVGNALQFFFPNCTAVGYALLILFVRISLRLGLLFYFFFAPAEVGGRTLAEAIAIFFLHQRRCCDHRGIVPMDSITVTGTATTPGAGAMYSTTGNIVSITAGAGA